MLRGFRAQSSEKCYQELMQSGDAWDTTRAATRHRGKRNGAALCSVSHGGCCEFFFAAGLLGEESVQLCHDLECVCNVKDICFAARPAAVGIEVDGATLIDEAPADNVRFFSMTTG